MEFGPLDGPQLLESSEAQSLAVEEPTELQRATLVPIRLPLTIWSERGAHDALDVVRLFVPSLFVPSRLRRQ
jgi:hypothetical protein